jgi:hypothetical protein
VEWCFALGASICRMALGRCVGFGQWAAVSELDNGPLCRIWTMRGCVGCWGIGAGAVAAAKQSTRYSMNTIHGHACPCRMDYLRKSSVDRYGDQLSNTSSRSLLTADRCASVTVRRQRSPQTTRLCTMWPVTLMDSSAATLRIMSVVLRSHYGEVDFYLQIAIRVRMKHSFPQTRTHTY